MPATPAEPPSPGQKPAPPKAGAEGDGRPPGKAKALQFTRDDVVHASLGAVPGFVVVSLGHLTVGLALLIGLLPTSLLGIAPRRKIRLIYGLLGCLFGVGVSIGAWIVDAHELWLTAAILLAVAIGATLAAARRPAGGLLLSLVIPSIAVGTGYSVAAALRLSVAFILGSLWSAVVSLLWPEYPPDPETPRKLQALQPGNPVIYGVLLGLAAACSYLVGSRLDPDHAGWVATAAMLVMRPLQQMTGPRGVGRALSTVIGTVLVVWAIHLDLSHLLTAVVAAAVTVLAIGGRTSRWYITSFGTAFLILTIELYGEANEEAILHVAAFRILDNVVGAAIALLFGLLVPMALVHGRLLSRPKPAVGDAAG